MQFLTKNKTPQLISLADFGINECSSVKYLGITIDNALSWNPHISVLCSKLSKISLALRTIYPLMQADALLSVYHGYFSSVMTYGVEVWARSPHAVRVFLEQKRAVCTISDMPSCRVFAEEF